LTHDFFRGDGLIHQFHHANFRCGGRSGDSKRLSRNRQANAQRNPFNRQGYGAACYLRYAASRHDFAADEYLSDVTAVKIVNKRNIREATGSNAADIPVQA